MRAERLSCFVMALGGERGEDGVEVFEAGILDDDAAFAFFVFDFDLEAQGALEAALGFADVASGPFVRSSYHADEMARSPHAPSASTTTGGTVSKG